MEILKLIKKIGAVVFQENDEAPNKAELPVYVNGKRRIVKLAELLEKGYEAIDPDLTSIRIPTSISDVRAKGELRYRGYDINDLVKHCSYEETAYLLLRGELPVKTELAKFKSDMANAAILDDKHQKALMEALKAVPINEKTDMLSLLAEAITVMDAMEKLPTSNEKERYDSALRTMAVMPTLVGLVNARLKAGNYPMIMKYNFPKAEDFGENGADFSLAKLTLQSLKQGAPITPEQISTMDKYLILHAEHGHNLSSLTARIVASAESKAGAWRFTLGGVESLQGDQHGNAATNAYANIEEINQTYPGATPEARAQAYFNKIIAAKKERAVDKSKPDAKIPGVGHGIYENYDPRAAALGGILESANVNSDEFRVAKKLDELVKKSKFFGKREGGDYKLPNVDFYSGVLLTQYLGVDKRLLGLMFADGRDVGWQAHTMEHKRDVGNQIMRPEAYAMAKDRDYLPIDDRTVPSRIATGKADAIFPESNKQYLAA